MSRGKSLSAFTVIVMAVCLSLVGMALIPQLAFKLLPSAQQPTVTVSFSMSGATSKVVETEVTSRLEAALARVESVRKMTSTSSNGGGHIQLRLDEHADLEMTRFEVSTLVRQVWHELPEGVSYPQVSVGRSSRRENGPFMIYTINAESDQSEIAQEAEQVFQTAFAEVKGVSDVAVRGALPREWRILYDANMASALGVSHADIVGSVRGRRFETPIGNVRLSLPADSAVDLANYTVQRADSQLVRLSSFATLERRESPARNYFRINGLNSVYLTISASDEANQVATQKEVLRVIDAVRHKLPAGYEMHKTYDATEYIVSELDKIYFRSGLTTLILLFFVFLSTLSVRSVSVVVISLVSDISIAAIFYYLLGIEMHLYSLASVTISLNLMIDNTIVMADHWRRERNLRAVAPLLAATLTSVASLCVVFFHEGVLRESLEEFAKVMIVNLSVSMCVSLFLVPALEDVIGRGSKREERVRSPRRWTLRLLVRYRRVASCLARHRKKSIAAVVLIFGLPLFLMPQKIESEGFAAETYNTVFGGDVYQRKIRPWLDVALGGTLRIFCQLVSDTPEWSDDAEVRLTVNATLPNGSTLKQMDDLMRQMESFLSKYKEIRQFQTDVRDARRGSIVISFVKSAQRSSFPYQLKQEIVSRAIELGAGSWNVYGLQDNGFSNAVRETSGSYMISLWGYNYDELLKWSDSITCRLLSNRRISEVTCNSQFSYWKDDYTEFVLTPDPKSMAERGVGARELFGALKGMFDRGTRADAVWAGKGYENIIVQPAQSEVYDIWSMRNMPIEIGNRTVKLSELCQIKRQTSPKSIEKENQQYRLCIQYEYIGSGKVGNRLLEKTVSDFASQMPIGFSIESERRGVKWSEESAGYLGLLALVILIMYFIGAILFDSLRLPLVVIAVLPFAFIGLFLTFYLFDLRFDQGGIAAMVLLCGITVNSSIYVVCEYQHLLRLGRPAGWHSYLRAFSVKFVPICLTVLSTVLGFVPFLFHASDETFWFSMAAGTIGGLVMSVIGVCLFLPVVMGRALGRSVKKMVVNEPIMLMSKPEK